MRSFCVFFLTAALSLLASEHRGQVRFGGLPVPGATVTATLGDKQLVAVTDGQGEYTFADLADGAWTIEVQMQCFSTVAQMITTGQPAQVDLKLLPLSEIKA